MSSIAPTVTPVPAKRTSALSATFQHTRYILGENRVTAFAFVALC